MALIVVKTSTMTANMIIIYCDDADYGDGEE